MDNDDRPVGRVLSRREVLALFGAAGAAALAACTTPATATPAPTAAPTVTVPVFASSTTASATSASATVPAATTTAIPATAAPTLAAATAETVALPACLVRPAQTEGPYFVDEMLNRSDIRSDPAGGAAAAGVPLVLSLRLAQLNGAACTALPAAQVDLWHCDAQGVYSDVGSAAGRQFLRGYQLSDDAGLVTFTTIYPGWYQGRTAHIHFKVRTSAGLEFTSQLYFDEGINDTVYGLSPYNTRGQRTTRNADDAVYRSGGDQLLLALTTIEEGYAAAFDLGLQLS